jgi:DNA-binding transcriptional regulator YdaS (Cro superfamily)
MTTRQYLALRSLDIGPASKRTAALLGISLSSLQRIAAGRQDVPPTVSRLLAMYQTHGLPPV